MSSLLKILKILIRKFLIILRILNPEANLLNVHGKSNNMKPTTTTQSSHISVMCDWCRHSITSHNATAMLRTTLFIILKRRRVVQLFIRYQNWFQGGTHESLTQCSTEGVQQLQRIILIPSFQPGRLTSDTSDSNAGRKTSSLLFLSASSDASLPYEM